MTASSIHDDGRVTAPSAASPPIDEGSLRYPGWRVVLACFLAAVFCWGFGLYSHGVYLTELHRLHGWPTSLISGAVTGFYLLTALFVVFISDAISRLGPKLVMLGGMLCFGTAVALLAVINAPWQLYLAYMLMAAGAATMHVGAISNVVGLWFNRQRPLAISLALNGASSGGILVAPALVLAIAYFGFPAAILGAMLLVAAILLPAIALWVDRPPARGADSTAAAATTGWTRAGALRSRNFWIVAAPFAMALTAQVGFLVHQIAIVEPSIGRTQAGLSVGLLTVAALIGRIMLGAWAGRLDLRRYTAWSLASQAVALLAMAATSNNAVLLIACAVYGFSAGNLVTLPSLVIQREFETKAFGMVVGLCWAIIQFTYAFGPGIMGVLRDVAGSYVAALALCIALKVSAGILVLLRPRSDRAD
ncbi:MAG: MFS transporter [Xanthobacteraceae bacterium]|nr:MFS transporter [Xanthobacteraceae bacterium]